MKVRLRYFAALREALGSGETIELAAGSTVSGLRELLLARGGPHAEVLAHGRPIRCALDQNLCDEATVLHEDAEVAFFPPITGG
jgi:molybdopterin synthase sulfur carrier subunit